MKSVLLFLAATALVGAAGCDLTGQKQTAQGSLQLPGQRPAMGGSLNRPPDERAAPAVAQAGDERAAPAATLTASANRSGPAR